MNMDNPSIKGTIRDLFQDARHELLVFKDGHANGKDNVMPMVAAIRKARNSVKHCLDNAVSNGFGDVERIHSIAGSADAILNHVTEYEKELFYAKGFTHVRHRRLNVIEAELELALALIEKLPTSY